MEYPEYEELVFDGLADVDHVELIEPKPRKKKAESTHTVVSSDTWGRLVEKYGQDIAEKNGKTFRDPLVAGAILKK